MQQEPALCYAKVPTSCKTKACLHSSDPLLRVSHFLFVRLFVLLFCFLSFLGVFFSARSHTTYLHDTKIHGMRELKIRLDIISGSCYKRRKYPMQH